MGLSTIDRSLVCPIVIPKVDRANWEWDFHTLLTEPSKYSLSELVLYQVLVDKFLDLADQCEIQ
jgi:hypothetical protein